MVRAASARGTEERSEDAWTPVEDAVETRIEIGAGGGEIDRDVSSDEQTAVVEGSHR
jgi:hypothetical protein